MTSRNPWFAALLMASVGAYAQMPVADLILTHARVHTQDPSQPEAEAVVVQNGRIVFVGSAQNAAAYQGAETRVEDLGGRTVLPGLSDAHVHLQQGEFFHHQLCDVRAFSVEEGLDRAKRCAATAPEGDWVVGYGWYDLDEPAFDHLTREQLDSVAGERRLAIISRDSHTIWVNTRVLNDYAIADDTPSPTGGQIVRDATTGAATGMLIDAAALPVLQDIQYRSSYSKPLPDLLKAAVRHFNTLGITSLLDAFADEETLNAYVQLDRTGQLNARVTLAAPVMPGNFREEIPRIAQRRQLESANVRLRYVKVLADGNGEVGLASYLHRDGSGGKSPGYYSDAEMAELVALAEKHDLAVFVHTIGDGAARQVLDAVEAARHRSPVTALRHTLTHLCWIDTADMPRLTRLGVVANIQEGWLAPAAFGGPPGYDYSRSTATGPLGPWLAGRVMPYGDLQAAGARLAAGSDWFYTDENPWNDLQAGVTARDPDGANPQAMLPEYAVGLPALLAARTTGGAFQAYREGDFGAVVAGRRADLIVLDKDPMDLDPMQIHSVQVDQTYFDGKLVYER